MGVHLALEGWRKVHDSRRIVHVCRYSDGNETYTLHSREQRIERHKRRPVREVGSGPDIALKSY